jgi:competence ComEA-like helix-hairpin-helix protein
MFAQHTRIWFAIAAAMVFWLVFAIYGRDGEPVSVPWQDVNVEVEAWLAATDSGMLAASSVPAGAPAKTMPSAPAAIEKTLPSGGDAPAAASFVVDLNTATAAQLDTLPGIGKTKAEAIIAYREENGPYGRVEDVMKVKGIGPAIFEDIQASLAAGYQPQEK